MNLALKDSLFLENVEIIRYESIISSLGVYAFLSISGGVAYNDDDIYKLVRQPEFKTDRYAIKERVPGIFWITKIGEYVPVGHVQISSKGVTFHAFKKEDLTATTIHNRVYHHHVFHLIALWKFCIQDDINSISPEYCPHIDPRTLTIVYNKHLKSEKERRVYNTILKANGLTAIPDPKSFTIKTIL